MPVIKSSNILAEHWLSIAREKSTTSQLFRTAIETIGMILFFESIKEMNGLTKKRVIKTPLKQMYANFVEEKSIYLVPILRAGLGMLTGIKNVIPQAKVAHVGLYRSEETLQPNWYLDKLPKKISKHSVFFVLEPMLATGGTISTVLERIQSVGVKKIYVIGVLMSKHAKNKLERKFPDVSFRVAGIDPDLNSRGFIVPGLGDAGDRTFNM